MKGHMQDGKFHPHTDYKKGVRKSRDQKAKTNGIRLARSFKLSEKRAKNFWNRLTPRSKFDVLTLELDLFLGNIPEHNEGKSFFDRSFDELPTKYQNLIRGRTLKQLNRVTGMKGTPVQAFSPLSVRMKREVELDVSNPLDESTTPRRTKAMLMKLETKNPVLSEKEINWMKNNINGSFMNSKGKTNEFGMKVQEIIDNKEGGFEITSEQNQKGLDWLKKKPQQNMMGDREKGIVDNFDSFKLDGFYDAGNSFRSFFVPLWKVSEKPDKDGNAMTMLYYNSGGMQIIG